MLIILGDSFDVVLGVTANGEEGDSEGVLAEMALTADIPLSLVEEPVNAVVAVVEDTFATFIGERSMLVDSGSVGMDEVEIASVELELVLIKLISSAVVLELVLGAVLAVRLVAKSELISDVVSELEAEVLLVKSMEVDKSSAVADAEEGMDV